MNALVKDWVSMSNPANEDHCYSINQSLTYCSYSEIDNSKKVSSCSSVNSIDRTGIPKRWKICVYNFSLLSGVMIVLAIICFININSLYLVLFAIYMVIDLEKLRKDPHIITSDTAGAALNRHNNNGEFARFIKKNIMECDFDGDTYMIGPNPNTYGNGEVGVLQKVGNKWVWSWHNTITTNWSSHLVIYETYNLVCKNYLGLEPLSNEEILSSVDTVYEKLTSLFETFRNEIFTPISTKKTSPFWQMYFICQNTWNKSLIDEIKFIRSVFDNDVTVVKCYERGSASDIRGGDNFTLNVLTY